MHVILKGAPNMTDLYLTFYIGGFDNVDGLCSGLPPINPRRVIVVDACNEIAPKKIKQTTKLLAALVSVIPIWDKMPRSLNRSTEFMLTPASSCSEYSSFRTWLTTDLRPYAHVRQH